MKKSSSSKKSSGMKKAQVGGSIRKAQVGQFLKKICRPGDSGCAGTRGLVGYGRGGGRRGYTRSPR